MIRLMSNTDRSVSLREVTAKSLATVLRLQVAESQRGFVATNAESIAEAHFSKRAWFRAIYAGETPVGFVMLSDDREKPEYYLWRLMIDAEHQGNGYGRLAIQELLEHVRRLPGATELRTSIVLGDGNPGPFYEKLGFALTGEIDEGEHVLRLSLDG